MAQVIWVRLEFEDESTTQLGGDNLTLARIAMLAGLALSPRNESSVDITAFEEKSL